MVETTTQIQLFKVFLILHRLNAPKKFQTTLAVQIPSNNTCVTVVNRDKMNLRIHINR